MNPRVVFFSKTKDPYGEFSNFYPASFSFHNLVWKSSEHAYQAMKFENPEHQQVIWSQPNAFMAAKVGRETTFPIRPDWLLVRDSVMSQVTYAKFVQNEPIKNLLLSTDDVYLVELSYKDDYWGSKPDLSGENRLGKILMKHRQLFRTLD